MKTNKMLRLEEYFEISSDPVGLFVRLACITGVNNIGHQFQPKTVNQVYDIFVRTIKLLFINHSRTLGMNYDDDGIELDNHQLLIKAKVPTLKDFSRQMDEFLGSAHYENRIKLGYSYPNLIVKEILVYWLYLPQVREFIKGFDGLIQTMDQIKTAEDSYQSVKCFGSLVQGAVAGSLRQITEQTALGHQTPTDEARNDFLLMYALHSGLNGASCG